MFAISIFKVVNIFIYNYDYDFKKIYEVPEMDESSEILIVGVHDTKFAIGKRMTTPTKANWASAISYWLK